MLKWINLYESLFNSFSHQWSIVSHTVTRFLTLQMRKIRFINALFLVNSPCFLMIFNEHRFYLSELLILDNTKHSRKKHPAILFSSCHSWYLRFLVRVLKRSRIKQRVQKLSSGIIVLFWSANKGTSHIFF